MAGASTYLEDLLLNEVLSGADYTPVGTVYIALLTAEPDDDDDTLTMSEANYTSYARVPKTNDNANWPASSGNGIKVNGTSITFPANTGGSQVVTHWAIVDGAGAANILWWGRLSEPVNIDTGDDVVFAAGALEIVMD